MTSVDDAVSPLRYVALGDSYTIGEGVAEHERWPNQLVERLRADGVAIDLVANPSVTGWTTADLIEHELPVLETSTPSFATLLIGVNDWVQDVPLALFEERLGIILDRMQGVLHDPRRLVLVTIPDFSVTPTGGQYARGRDITAGLSMFNAAIKAQATARGIAVADIFPLSRSLGDPQFVVEDGLHPSGEAYRRWIDVIYPVTSEMLTCP